MELENGVSFGEKIKTDKMDGQSNAYVLEYDAFLRTLKENTNTGHVFLLGAGTSISSGIQSASDCIWEWKKNIFITKNPNLAQQYNEYKSETVQRSIQRWLDTEGSYPQENSAEEYSFYAQKAYPIDETRRKYFENICRGKEPHIGYKILCLLAKYGMVRSVFTTNFDGLVEKASHQLGLTPIAIALDAPDRIHRVASANELLSVSLHGDFKYGPLKNTGNELDTQHEVFVGALEQHLYDKHLVVIGYSGRDNSLMEAIKKAYSKPGAGMLFWCGYGHDINSNVSNLLTYINDIGRRAFYTPTEGFDNTLIHISKTCFGQNKAFEKDSATILQNTEEEGGVRSPFSMDVRGSQVILKSNLFPVSLPTEVFQLEAPFKEGERVWATIKELCKDKPVSAVPLKKNIYALGIQTQIREAFTSRLIGEIKRTPVTYQEIKEGSVFKNLYLKTIIKAICEMFNLETDGFEKIYLPNSKVTQIKDGITYDLFDAVELGLFFDNKINAVKPFAYLSLKPTFYLKSNSEIPKSLKFEVGKNYHDLLLKGQPNVRFSTQIERWKSILFSTGRLQFEYPINSGTGFKFSISPNTMHVSIIKAQGGYNLRLPDTFDNRLILHNGIQYQEPTLEFISRTNGEIIKDFHPMRGLIKNRPYDFSLNGNVFDAEINIGLICPINYKEMLYSFLNRLNKQQTAGAFNPEYLMDYPGFTNAYGIPFNIPDTNSDLWKNCSVNLPPENLMQSAIDLANQIKRAIDQLEAVNKKLVIVVFIPNDWNVITEINNEDEKFDLHDYIKAYAAQKQMATQFIQESTFIDPLTCQVN